MVRRTPPPVKKLPEGTDDKVLKKSDLYNRKNRRTLQLSKTL